MTAQPEATPIIGRGVELALLDEAYAAATGGEPRVVLIGGETGIGKSRLIAEFAATARAGGALVLASSAPVLVGNEVPFAPIVGLLRILRSATPPEEFGRLIPLDCELAALLPAGMPGTAPVGGPASQARLFEQMLALLIELGASRAEAPAVVIIEDAHWADASTRDMLAYLIANLSQARIVLLVSYRDDLGPSHPLQRLLIEATRQRSVRSVDLEGLTEVEARAVLASRAAEPIADERMAEIVDRAGGNPLFIEQLAGALSSGLPATLTGLVRARLAELTDGAAQLLRLAAVAGAGVPAGILEGCAMATGVDPGRAIQEIRPLRIMNLGDEGGLEAYRFRHQLIQEVIYTDLTPTDRRQLHALVGAGLQQSATDTLSIGHAIELGRHWVAAGDPARAFPWLVRAARAAEAVYAFVEAHLLYERAIDALDSSTPQSRGPARIGFRPTPEGPDERKLFERAAQSASLAGRPDRAVALIDVLIERTPKDGLLLAHRAQYLWESGARADAVVAYRDAIARLPDVATSESTAVLRHAARAMLLTSHLAEARDLATRALDIARSSGDAAAERQALFTVGAALAYSGDGVAAGEMLDQARVLEAEEYRRSQRVRPSRIADTLADDWSRATILARAGKPAESAEAALRAVQRARDLGVKQVWGDLAGLTAAEDLIELGRWQDAGSLLEELLAHNPGVGSRDLRAVRARLLALKGMPGEAIAELAQAPPLAAAPDDPRTIFRLARAEADVAGTMDQLNHGSSVLGHALAALGTSGDRHAKAELLASALEMAADRILVAKSRRANAEVADIELDAALLRGELLAVAGDVKSQKAGPWLTTLRDWGLLEHRRVGREATAADWLALATRWRDLSAPYRAARAAFRAAEALLSARSTKEGGEQLRAAHETALALGAESLRRQVKSLARRARVSLADDSPPGAGSATEGPGPARVLGLSVRELEVIALVAQGRSNRQIAEALFITEKTAGHHVSSILAKLGVASRVEAAGVAIRAGIVGGEVAVAVGATHGLGDEDNPSPDRLVATLMFTDVVKSTALLDAIGDQAWSMLVTWHDRTLRALFAGHAGREIDHAGDGFFVAFPDIVAGLDCAVMIQRTLAQHRHTQGFAPRLRIALHSAAVTRRGSGVQGRGVHEAARIVAAAAADEILVSADSLPSDGRHARLEPRQIQAAGFREPIQAVPIEWR